MNAATIVKWTLMVVFFSMPVFGVIAFYEVSLLTTVYAGAVGLLNLFLLSLIGKLVEQVTRHEELLTAVTVLMSTQKRGEDLALVQKTIAKATATLQGKNPDHVEN